MKRDTKNLLTAGVVVLGIGVMALVPYLATKRAVPLQNKEGSLTPTQRQRGMFQQVGVQDGGRDPDWDPVHNRWTGFDNKKKKTETNTTNEQETQGK